MGYVTGLGNTLIYISAGRCHDNSSIWLVQQQLGKQYICIGGIQCSSEVADKIEDNKGSIDLAKNAIFHIRTKYIELRH